MLKRVFKSWISEMDWNRPLFLLTKTSNEKMYWDGSESICNCLNSWRHESRIPVFVMILIILFLNFKNFSNQPLPSSMRPREKEFLQNFQDFASTKTYNPPKLHISLTKKCRIFFLSQNHIENARLVTRYAMSSTFVPRTSP